VPLDAVERGIARLQGVPGRFEQVSSSADDISVIVDYAHTDDALRNLLEMARPLAPRRLITVFGAGGDRDPHDRQPVPRLWAGHGPGGGGGPGGSAPPVS